MADGSPASMAVISSQYETRVTRVAIPGTSWARVLGADPRRFYVRVEGDAVGIITLSVMPGPAQNISPPGNNHNIPCEFKFRDCPSIVAGEFYGFANPASDVIIIECLYNGD